MFFRFLRLRLGGGECGLGDHAAVDEDGQIGERAALDAQTDGFDGVPGRIVLRFGRGSFGRDVRFPGGVEPVLAGVVFDGDEGGKFLFCEVAQMGDFRDRLRGDEQTPGLGHAQGQLHEVDLPFGLLFPAVDLGEDVNGVGPGREQLELAPVGAQLVLAVEDEAADAAAFAVVFAALFLLVDHAVAEIRIVAAEVVELADEILFGQDDDFVSAVLADADEAVELVAHHRVFALDFGADVAVLAVPADLDVVEGGLLAVDLVEVFDLGAAGIGFAVLVDEFAQIIDGVVAQVVEVFAQLLHGVEDLAQFTLVFLDVEAADAPDGQGQQFVDVLVGDFAHEQRAERLQPGADLFVLLLLAAALLDALVDAVLEEDLGQGLGEEELGLTAVLVLQLQIEVFQEFFGVAADHLMHGHLHGLAVADDRHVDRDGDGALRVHVEGLKGLLGVRAAHGDDADLHLFGGVVVDAGDAYLVLFGRLFDGGDEALGGGGRGDLADDQLPAVDLDPRAEDDAAVAVVVLPGVHESALEEVGIKLEGFAPQRRDLGLQKFVEIVGHDARGHADGDAVAAQHEERGDLDRQDHGLLIAAVVGIHEFGDLVGKQHFAAQGRKAALDIPWRGGGTAGEDVAEVPLLGDEVLLVGQHHQGVADGGVAVGVVVHGVADDVGGLVGPAVVDAVEHPEDAALDGFEAVVHVGDGPVLDDVGGVVEEVAVHHGPEIGVAVAAALADGGLAVALGLGNFRDGGVEDFGRLFSGIVRAGIFGDVTHTWRPPGWS